MAAAKTIAHVVVGNTSFRCLHCGTEMPWPSGGLDLNSLKGLGKGFEKTHKSCKPSEAGKKRFEFSTPEEWLQSWDTGISSRTLWASCMGRLYVPGGERGIPHDPADFGRCYRLLAKFPQWKEKFPRVKEENPQWIPFIDNWEELTKLYEEELPSGSAPKLRERMKSLVEESRRICP